MGDATGLAWAKYWRERHDARREAEKRTRAHAEESIEWLLPPELLPVTTERIKWSRIDRHYHTVYYTNGSKTPQQFVYLLQSVETGEVRYVGLTDDPPRRHMEHRRSKKFGIGFKMVIVAVGDEATEKDWITRQLEQGSKLLNKISIDRG